VDATATYQPKTPADRSLEHPAALVILASVHEPARVGEIAFLPRPGEPELSLGRADGLEWQQQRPGSSRRTGPLADPHLSRRQVVFSATGGRLQAENLGRLPMRLNGHPAQSCPIVPGDLLQVGDRMLIAVISRPLTLPGTVEPGHPFGGPDAIGWVGESPASWQLRSLVRFVAGRDQHVLVLGESGTGKELVANGLHALSPRAGKPFVSRSAATIPESLADAELFGNLAGYPNPGMPGRAGLVGEADKGTLFLDEFGELPLELQARLLRVLDSGEYTRLGEARPRYSNLRLVAATNRDPSSLKHDVLARFPLTLAVPPLTERMEDVPLVAMHLMRRIAAKDSEVARRYFDAGGWPRLSLDLVRRLVVHPYSTHVRELHALLWAAMTHSAGEVVEDVHPDVAPLAARPSPQADGPVDPAMLDPATIQAALDRHGGRQEPVWRELGLSSRHALTRLVKKYGLNVRGRT
jgi:two-component system response regulator HydG